MARRETGTAYLLWCASLVGVCGLQRYYLGQTLVGTLYLLSFGFCGLGQLMDLSRLEAGASPMRLIEMDMGEVIEDVVSEARLRDPKTEIVVAAQMRPYTAQTVHQEDLVGTTLAWASQAAVRHGSAHDRCR